MSKLLNKTIDVAEIGCPHTAKLYLPLRDRKTRFLSLKQAAEIRWRYPIA